MFDLARDSSKSLHAITQISRLLYDALLRQQEIDVNLSVGTVQTGNSECRIKPDGSFEIHIVAKPLQK